MTELHVDRGGDGDRMLVLLHGLGANAAVWKPMLQSVDQYWSGKWIAPDFRGHGRSPFEGPYGFAAHAADVARLIADEAGPVYVVGHSFGGVVGALLSGGLFGPQPDGLFAFGVKLHWTADEIAKSREVAGKPRRMFNQRSEAIERYLKGAGLFGLLDQGSQDASLGVEEASGGFQVRLDPRAFQAVGPEISHMFRQVGCPVRLAAGARDPMVSLDQMRPLDPDAVVIPDAGHNVHFEKPEALWASLTAFIDAKG